MISRSYSFKFKFNNQSSSIFIIQISHTTIQTLSIISSYHHQQVIYQMEKNYQLYNFTFNLLQNSLICSITNSTRKIEGGDHVTLTLRSSNIEFYEK